jgi:hypothetical protein
MKPRVRTLRTNHGQRYDQHDESDVRVGDAERSGNPRKRIADS